MKYKAHNYQKLAINKIVNTPKCGLFLDMGFTGGEWRTAFIWNISKRNFIKHREKEERIQGLQGLQKQKEERYPAV